MKVRDIARLRPGRRRSRTKPAAGAAAVGAAALGGGALLRRAASRRPVELERSVSIGKAAEELHRLWREPGTLGRVMGDFADVAPAGDGRHRWSLRGPLGRSLEWETEIVEDRPGELVRWQAVEGSGPRAEGAVRFRPAPGDWGTEVTLELRFDAPPGLRGGGLAQKVLPGKVLRRFKSLAETGEIPTTEHNPSARAE